MRRKVNLQALFFCSSTQTMPQDNRDKNENVTSTPSHGTVFNRGCRRRKVSKANSGSTSTRRNKNNLERRARHAGTSSDDLLGNRNTKETKQMYQNVISPFSNEMQSFLFCFFFCFLLCFFPKYCTSLQVDPPSPAGATPARPMDFKKSSVFIQTWEGPPTADPSNSAAEWNKVWRLTKIAIFFLLQSPHPLRSRRLLRPSGTVFFKILAVIITACISKQRCEDNTKWEHR